MAGVAGFEPTNAGVKDPCLTPWLHPSDTYFLIKGKKKCGVGYGIRTHDFQCHKLAL